MDWKKQLSDVENHFGCHKKRDWSCDIEMVKNLVKKYPHDVEVYIRSMYLIHNILVEEDYSNDEFYELDFLLKEFFEKSYSVFSENSEYLFFIGKILHIAEWHFGLEDTALATEMQRRAMEKEPHNLLYEWAYRLSCSDDRADYLANQIINYEKEKIEWLKRKGFPGQYVLEHLRMCNKSYLEREKSN